MFKQILSASSLVCAFALLISPSSLAQDNSGQMTIDIEIIEDGETRKIQRTVDKGDTQSIEAILKELDALNDMDLTGSGEKIEIKVRKSVDGERAFDRDYDIQMFNGDNDWTWDEDSNGGFLGVYINMVHGDDGKAEGVQVTSVIDDSAADLAGVEEGDIIKTVNGESMTSESQLIDKIRSIDAGESVEVGFERDGKEATITAELGKRKHDFPHQGKRKMIFKGMDDDDFMDYEIRDMLMNEGFGGREMDDMINRRMKKFQHTSADPDQAFLGIASMTTCGDAEVKGAKISTVYKNSTAKEMGLVEGDVIIEMNGQSISNFGDLVDVMDNLDAGDKLSLIYERDGKKFTEKADLKKRSEVFPNEFKYDCGEAEVHNHGHRVVKEIELKIELKDCTLEDEQMLREPAAVNFDTELKLNSIEFAPNPSNGEFSLSIDLPETADTRVMIFDGNGRQIYTKEMRGFSGVYNQTVDISDQPNGIYFLIVAQGEKQFTKKVLKQ
jgi:PDZ domain-containing secreted protein